VPASETVIQGDGLIVSGILNAKINKTCRRSFSREAVKILRCWLEDHVEHPYPDPKEKEVLQMKTGLRKDQVSNWLANARRRGKAQRGVFLSPPLTSPNSYNSPTDLSVTVPMQIPGRGFGSYQDSDPLNRYVTTALHNMREVSRADLTFPAKLAIIPSRARICLRISHIKCYRFFVG